MSLCASKKRIVSASSALIVGGKARSHGVAAIGGLGNSVCNSVFAALGPAGFISSVCRLARVWLARLGASVSLVGQVTKRLFYPLRGLREGVFGPRKIYLLWLGAVNT